jgi:hypothetical protein
MATIDRVQINELMSRAEQLGHGPTEVGLLEEAVRLADLLADIPLAYRARTKLITAAKFGGSPEKAMVAFSWCLAQMDRSPEQFNERETLWQYKWVIGSLSSFPQLSREQIKAALEDLGRRIERTGYGIRPVYKLQYTLAGEMGDLDEFHEAHARWVASPRGELSDCQACDIQAEVEYLVDSGRDEDAIHKARPIFEGRSRCTVVPHTTLARSLLPLVRLGRLEEAMANHRKGYRLIAGNRYYLQRFAQHLDFLAITDNLAKGLKLFEAHFPWSLECFDLDDRFRFSLASRFLFERLLLSGKKTVKLRMPSTFPLFNDSGKYDLSALIAWLEADSVDLAARFDARNGNDSFARRIEASRELQALVTPFPLKGSTKEN